MEDYNFYAVLDENNITMNVFIFPKNPETFIDPESGEEKILSADSLLDSFPNCTLQQYGEGITNNFAAIGFYYDSELNAFISPKPDPTYILNVETFEWEPDENLTYNLHGDGIMYKWIKTGWALSDE
jgi:hypothetical protein